MVNILQQQLKVILKFLNSLKGSYFVNVIQLM